MNQKMNDAAVHGLTAPGYVREHGMCEKWAREVIQSQYDDRFDGYFKATAALTMEAFKHSPYAIEPVDGMLGGGSVPGDILFKGLDDGPAGHVGIRVLGNKVAENSSAHIHNGDARGTRTLEEFGKIDLIVRLPQL